MIVLNRLVALIGVTYVYIYNYFHTNGFVLVEIDKGVLRGANATTWRGEKYFSFKGIPYAKPPVGELRFKGPREEAAWAGVRDALHHGDICPQIDIAFEIFLGKEDCLFLNVYTPSLEDKLMPVMVWIHGGLFMLGSGDDELWGPDYFMSHGVVVVTINYRLGALGYLTTEDDNAPGNAGMKDQVAALRWVKRNIAKFGGDPDNVTIFGASTGGSSVHLHVLSPMSSGLFKRAISQSSSALHAWGLPEERVPLTMRLVEALTDAKDIVGDKTKAFEFLMKASHEDIIKAQRNLMTQREKEALTLFLFKPSMEKNVKSEEVFLSDSPLNIIKSGNFNKVPYILGYNNREGYFFRDEVEDPEIMKAALEDTERYVPVDIRNTEMRSELVKSITQFFFDDKPIAMQNISNLVDLYSDLSVVAGLKRHTKLHLQSVDTPTYFYVLSHDGKLNLLKFFLNVNCSGAIHGDELGYLFHHRLLFWKNPLTGSTDEHVAATMTRLWTNFAKYGNPTPPGDPLTWKPTTLEEFNYLNISGWDTKMDVNPDEERTTFWENAYKKDEALRN